MGVPIETACIILVAVLVVTVIVVAIAQFRKEAKNGFLKSDTTHFPRGGMY